MWLLWWEHSSLGTFVALKMFYIQNSPKSNEETCPDQQKDKDKVKDKEKYTHKDKDGDIDNR